MKFSIVARDELTTDPSPCLYLSGADRSDISDHLTEIEEFIVGEVVLVEREDGPPVLIDADTYCRAWECDHAGTDTCAECDSFDAYQCGYAVTKQARYLAPAEVVRLVVSKDCAGR